MTINKNMIITLDNNESYFVASTCKYNNEKYGLLISINKDNNYMVTKLFDEYIEKLDDRELSNIYPLLNDNLN